MITRTVTEYTVDAVVKQLTVAGEIAEQTVQVTYTNLRNPETVTEKAIKDIQKEYPRGIVIVGNVTAVTKKYSMGDEFFYANAKEEIIE